MRIVIPHGTSPGTAKKRLRSLFQNLKSRYGDLVSDVDEHWEGESLQFAFKARGVKAKGSVEITDDQVIVEGKLPLLARPFESKIKTAIEREAKSLFS